MATDIKISELNEVTCNNDLNHIIINDRENAGDEGITKKIKLENFLTSNIVKETNIVNCAITREKIVPLAVDCSRIANNTITCNQIADCSINNAVLDSNAVDSRVLNNNCGFTVKCLTVDNGPVNIASGINGCLTVESGITKLNTIQYYWPTNQAANRFLKTNGAGGLSWEEAMPGESTSLVFAEIMPVGTIVPWAGIGTVPDDKWLECDGGTFNGTEYPDLSAALGDTWGTHSGVNYRLPDLQGRVIIGEGSGTDVNDQTINFSNTDCGGEYRHTLCITEMPSHRHVSPFGENSNQGNMRWGNFDTTTGVGTKGSLDNDNNRYGYTTCTGGSLAHNNIQPYVVTRYIIKAKKDDVEQFNPGIGPGLSAQDSSGQTSNITLTSTEIGVKIDNDTIKFDTNNSLKVSDDLVDTISYPVFVNPVSRDPGNNVWTTYNVKTILGLSKIPRAVIIDQEWVSGQSPDSFTRIRRAPGEPEYIGNAIHSGGSGDIERNAFQGTFPLSTNGSFQYKAYRSDGGYNGFRIIGYYT